MDTLRSLKKLLKDNERNDDTEVTHFKGEYYLLHILKNGVPIPYIHSQDIHEIRREIGLRILS